MSVATVDLNGDGKMDVVVADLVCSNNAGCMAVLLGNGDGTLQLAVTYSSGGYFTRSIAVADLNNDGNADVVVASCGMDGCSAGTKTGTVGVMLGNGDGTLHPVSSVAGPGSYFAVSVGDADGDSNQDLLVTNWSCANYTTCIGVMRGNGDGTFPAAELYDDSLSAPGWSILADINGDGWLDALVPQRVVSNDNPPPPGTVDVLLNTGLTATTTTLISSQNPVLFKHMVAYTATVTRRDGRPVTGTMFIAESGGFNCSVFLSDNQSVCTWYYYPKQIGAHTITATYSGDSNNAGSVSAPLTQYIQGTSTTRVVTSGTPSHAGQPVTFTATVISHFGKIPNGEMVTFYDGKTALGSVPLSNGTALYTTSSLTSKKHTIKAIYAGDLRFGASHGGVIQVVEP
jgi:hypothetical protein